MKKTDIELVLTINNVNELWRKGIEDLVPISEGYVAFYRSNIETDNCYGYFSADSASYDRACAASRNWKSDPKYFKEYNLEHFDARYKLSDKSGIAFRIKSDGDVKFAVFDSYTSDRPLTESERRGFAIIIEQMRAKFEKRLDTYIKKYGTKNLRAWTFDFYD